MVIVPIAKVVSSWIRKLKMQITIIEKKKNTKPLRVCAYARVSTSDQKSSIILQKRYWKEKLANMKGVVVIGVFADYGCSGRTQKGRAQFMKMINLAKENKVDRIYTKSISRFGRNFKETLEVSRHLRQKGVEIIFEKENINSCDLTSNLMLNIMVNIAEMESEIISSNVKWVCRNNFKRGKSNFHRNFFGYRKNSEGRYEIDKQESQIVKEIFRLSIEGYGQRKTQKIIKEKFNRELSVSGIDKILSSRKYMGEEILQDYYIQDNKVKRNKGELDKYIIRNKYPPIIDKTTWELSTAKKHQRYRRR